MRAIIYNDISVTGGPLSRSLTILSPTHAADVNDWGETCGCFHGALHINNGGWEGDVLIAHSAGQNCQNILQSFKSRCDGNSPSCKLRRPQPVVSQSLSRGAWKEAAGGDCQGDSLLGSFIPIQPTNWRGLLLLAPLCKPHPEEVP